MNRAGSVLQYNIAVKIAQLQTKAKVHTIGWVSPADSQRVFGNAGDTADEWFIVKMHHCDSVVDAFWQRVHPKAIYIYRDIRDVAVSTMNMESWSFDSPELEVRIYDVLRNYRNWIPKPGLLISRYEDLMASGGLAIEVEKIARYLGVILSADELEQITAVVSIREHKRKIEQFDYAQQGVAYPNTLFDPVSLFHNNHIHSGAVEQWRTALTPEQIALVETWSNGWLEELGYAVEPRSDEQRKQMAQQAFKITQEKLARQLDQNVGLLAYTKSLEQALAQRNAVAGAEHDVEIGADAPRRSDEARGEADVHQVQQGLEMSQSASRSFAGENARLSQQINALRQQIEAQQAQIDQLRRRKIVRIMAKLGRPLV